MGGPLPSATPVSDSVQPVVQAPSSQPTVLWRTVLHEALAVTGLSDMPAALRTIAEQPLGRLAAMAASLTAMAIEFRSSERLKMLIRAATTPQLMGAATNMWTAAKGAEQVAIAAELQQFVVVLRSGAPADLAFPRRTALKKLSRSCCF